MARSTKRTCGAHDLMARRSSDAPLVWIGRIERYTHGRSWALYLSGIYWITRRVEGKAGRSKFVHEPGDYGAACVTVRNLREGIALARRTLGMPEDAA